MHTHRDTVSWEPSSGAISHHKGTQSKDSKKRKREPESHGHIDRLYSEPILTPFAGLTCSSHSSIDDGDMDSHNEGCGQYEGSNGSREKSQQYEQYEQCERETRNKGGNPYEGSNPSDIDQSDRNRSTKSEVNDLDIEFDECKRYLDFNEDDGAESSSGKYYRWVAV